MPIAPFLAVSSRGTPQLKRYINATPSGVGAGFGIADTSAVGINVTRGYPAAIKFGGSQTFIATVGLDIYRSTDGGATWGSVFSFIPGTHLNAGASASKSGLFVLHVAGVATACIVTQNHPSSDWWAFTSSLGTLGSWTAHGPFSGPFAAYNDPHDSVVWNGSLVTMWGRGADLTTVSTVFDPTTNTMTFATLSSITPGAIVNDLPLCVFNNRLFVLNHESSAFQQGRLTELIAGAWVAVEAAYNFSSATNEGKNCLFTDGTNMYVFAPKSGTWKCYQYDSSLVRTDITAAVIPTALAVGVLNTARMSVIVDNRTSPGSAPTIWLHHSINGSPGSAINQWQWNGPGAYIGTGGIGGGPNDSGGSAHDNLPFVQHSQGTTFWTSGEDHVELKGLAPAAGGLLVSFKLYSDAGLGTASVRAWRGVANDELPLAAATLTGPTTGLAKDNTTVHQVTWQAATDGFSTGQRAKFVMEKF